jgi:hypothetical protein
MPFFQGLSPHRLTMGHQLLVSSEVTCIRVSNFVLDLTCQYYCSVVQLIRRLLPLIFSYTKQTRASTAKIALSHSHTHISWSNHVIHVEK